MAVKYNKLLETIRILDTLERKRFRNVIKNKTRGSLLALYELCLVRIDKSLPLPEKEEVYRFLFGETYTKENDFLLRNEYRLLADEAEAFLRIHAVEDQFPGLAEAARLKRILQSGNPGLFKKEFDRLGIQFGSDPFFWLAADPVFLEYFIESSAMTPGHFREVKEKITEARDRLDRFYNRISSEYEVRKSFADKVYSVIAEEPLTEEPSRIVPTKTEDLPVRFRLLKAASYYKQGQEKIDLLLQANEILKNNALPELQADESFWLQASIGLEYYLQYDFDHAVLYYEAMFATPGIEAFNRLPDVALNYFSALMSRNEHARAITAVSVFEHRIAASVKVYYKYICLKSLALMFMGQSSAARKELNRIDGHDSDNDFNYWRVSMILSFAAENRWEDAQNEFRNLQKTKSVKESSRQDLANLVYVVDRLLKCGSARESGRKVPETVWRQCDQKVKEMLGNPGDFLHPPRLVEHLLKKLDPRPPGIISR